jgi:putative ABC transport system permease protein
VTAGGTLERRPRVNGGLPARQALTRWAVRLFRREWRQQILVIVLLTVAVTGSTFGVATTYNLPTSAAASFGNAQSWLRFDGLAPATLAARLDAARVEFGEIETIGHRYAGVRGAFDPIDLRAQNPTGTYGSPMLASRSGRYPRAADEIAVTDGVARTLNTRPGARVRLDGHNWLVVGTVENPNNLADEFAVVEAAHADPPQSVTVLVDGDRAQIEAFRKTIPEPLTRESRPSSPRTLIALAALALAAAGLALVSLVAAAGFIVVAQRRMRQLGMLAAIGATRRQLRTVMVVNGVIVGAIAAVLGTTIGIVAWLMAAGSVETAAGHRIHRFDLPWPVFAAGMALAVGAATAAAWWPARTTSRTPIMSALSARPPRPRTARRSATLALVLLVVGLTGLAVAWDAGPFVGIVSALTTAAGILFAGPLAIRALAAVRHPMPVAARLALSDLARYQARAGAALAAISLTTGITITIVAGSAAAESAMKESAGLGNLSAEQLLVRIGQPDSMIPDRTSAQQAQAQRAMAAIAAELDTPDVIPVEMAVTLSATGSGERPGASGHPAVEVGVAKTTDDVGTGRRGGVFESYPAYVATPQLLALYGLAAKHIDAAIDVLSVRTEAFQLVNILGDDVHPKTRGLTTTGYTDVPDTLITSSAMVRHGWTAAPIGWFVQAGHQLTERELNRVRAQAADAGFTVESRREQASLSSLRTAATVIGILLCLGVLSTTVGLIRAEGANDLRTLTATGAPRRIRRSLTATTAGALALLGVVLGLAGAYLGLISLLHRDFRYLGEVPVTPLAFVVIGLPLVATVAGWVLAGRPAPTIARRRLD